MHMTMKRALFFDTKRTHRCTALAVLAMPGCREGTTVTFYWDPQGGGPFVWVFLSTRRTDLVESGLRVLDGAYTLSDDWGITLFTANARAVWDELHSGGWGEVSRGSLGRD